VQINQEIALYCPKAVKLFALTKLNLQQATNEVKYRTRDLIAQWAKKLEVTKSFQLSPSGGLKGVRTSSYAVLW
jgi:hypothetical protein